MKTLRILLFTLFIAVAAVNAQSPGLLNSFYIIFLNFILLLLGVSICEL